MVPRCGYYAHDGVLVRKTVWINWDKGFDREAKHAYGYALLNALKDVGPVAEVTSGSPIYETRMLSPLFVKMKNNPQLSVEDYLRQLQEMYKTVFSVKGLADMVYLQNLSPHDIDVMHKYNCYCDMFANPEKGFGNSQACSLAVYRVLEQLDLLHLLKDNSEFMFWYNNKMEISLVT